jgi:hypothetical protein
MKGPEKAQILTTMTSSGWPYACNETTDAVQEMADRIARTGRLNASLISYSNLVSGISFQFTNIEHNSPFVIDVQHWEGLHRRLVGDCLGYISYLSYRDYDFMASSLVAGLTTNQPSDLFFEWMEEIGVINNTKQATVEAFWVDQVKKSVAWYKKNPAGFKV